MNNTKLILNWIQLIRAPTDVFHNIYVMAVIVVAIQCSSAAIQFRWSVVEITSSAFISVQMLKIVFIGSRIFI